VVGSQNVADVGDKGVEQRPLEHLHAQQNTGS
jgi:hypothetical protein